MNTSFLSALRFPIGLVLVAAALVMSGCSALEKTPTISVRGVSLNAAEPADPGREAATIELELQNPNSIPLELDQVQYGLSIAGGERFQATRAALLTLPSNGSTRLLLPVVVPAGTSGSGYAVHGTIRYLAPGHIAEILFEAGVRRPRVGFNSTGVIAPPPS